MTMRQLAARFWDKTEVLREAASRLTVRRDTSPVTTVEGVFLFARSRAAFISQKKLYGYLKERIGTRYPKLFEEDLFLTSVNIAKVQVYAACLADMTCFCIANATVGPAFTNDDREALARRCYADGIAENTQNDADEKTREGWLAAFDARLGKTIWGMTGEGGQHFIESPAALIRWAPIADELKRLDVEIVENSMRFAWIAVRNEFFKRLDVEAVARDWDHNSGS